ncbi:MAG: S-layer protein [Actinomycetota bacterium]
MKLTSLATISLLVGSNFFTAVKAETIPQIQPKNSLTQDQILTACIHNQAETLPNPYTDVSPTHWAYKAVLSLYYCGAYREATPPALIRQLLEGDRSLKSTNPSKIGNREE